MPGPHRKMVTQEESATVSKGEGEGVAREAGRAERGGRGDGGVRGVQGGRGETETVLYVLELCYVGL
jgi:hypothetical protein